MGARDDFTHRKDTSRHHVVGYRDSITQMSILPTLTYKFNMMQIHILYQSRFSQANITILGSSPEGI